MSELLNQDRLRLIAVAMEQPFLLPRRQELRPQWVVDASNGRTVAHWVLADERDQAAPINR